MAAVEKGLILGAGIGGLGAGAALAQRGIETEIVEIRPAANVYGVGINQPANALRALRAIGVLDEVCDAGFQFARWDRDAARNYNTVDTSVIAHRRSEARFDEELETLGDWDMLLKLVADTEPVEVPAIAAYYRTDSPGRLSTTSPAEQLVRDYDRVRRKATAEAAALER
jgi:hypothetical protein